MSRRSHIFANVLVYEQWRDGDGVGIPHCEDTCSVVSCGETECRHCLYTVLGLVFILVICESFNSIILFCNISLRMFVLTLILQFKPTTDENPY